MTSFFLRHRVAAASVIVLAIVASAFGFALWVRRDLRKPIFHSAAAKEITIPSGGSKASIIAQLHREGIIRNELTSLAYLRLFQRGSFKAGTYQFKSPSTALQVIDKLVRGHVATRHFTVPEGFDQFDISQVLARLTGLKEISPPRADETLRLLSRTSLITDLDPNAKTLEGYLFPDTYEYAATNSREELVESMVRRFRKAWRPEMQDRARDLGMSLREVVTLASLIEKEAKIDSERELISSVFHRRMKKRMPLACDPTVVYALLLDGRYRGKIFQSDLDRDSPYNTYRRVGLPPGPIASPGTRSLQAALYPADTDFLYFVVDANRQDGSHHFSTSSAEHERAVATLRKFEREQPQK